MSNPLPVVPTLLRRTYHALDITERALVTGHRAESQAERAVSACPRQNNIFGFPLRDTGLHELLLFLYTIVQDASFELAPSSSDASSLPLASSRVEGEKASEA